MKVLIVGSSKLPIPAVKGGAVPNLIEQLIRQNEIDGKLELICCSLYDPDAEKSAKKYTKTAFIWAKQPRLIKWMDSFFYFFLSKVLHIKRLLSLSFLFQIIWLTFFVAKILRRGDYDQVVFENSIPILYSLKLWNNKAKYKGKYHLHMHSVPRSYYGNAQVIRDSKSLICISKYVANEMLKDSRLCIAADKIEIMYNCIDTKLFYPDKENRQVAMQIKEKHGIECEKKIILFIGRLCKEKGIAELLQAVKLINRNDVILLVVGSNFYKSHIVSPYENYLHSLAMEMSNKVIFTGFVDYFEVPKYYIAADVVVLPSMWDEPAGMTMVEAMACACPMVTTMSGGIPEYVGEGNCVMLKRDEKVISCLAESISNLLDNKKAAEEMAGHAATRASRYNLEFYYRQFLRILDV